MPGERERGQGEKREKKKSPSLIKYYFGAQAACCVCAPGGFTGVYTPQGVHSVAQALWSYLWSYLYVHRVHTGPRLRLACCYLPAVEQERTVCDTERDVNRWEKETFTDSSDTVVHR